MPTASSKTSVTHTLSSPLEPQSFFNIFKAKFCKIRLWRQLWPTPWKCLSCCFV